MANPSPFRGWRERAQFIATYDSVMRNWPIPFEERDVETACGQTHIVVSGLPSAPPVILLHAASATSAMWGPIIAATSSVYRCYMPDTTWPVSGHPPGSSRADLLHPGFDATY